MTGVQTCALPISLNVGFVVSLLSIAFGLSAVIVKLAGGVSVPGWASLMVLFGLVGGSQLLVLGVIGEYVGRIYDEVKQRPLYLVREQHGLDDDGRT